MTPADIRNLAAIPLGRPGRAQRADLVPAGRPVLPPGRAVAAGGADRPTARAATPLAPGLAEIARDALGPVRLPPRLDLVAALEAARQFAPMADRAVPGLGRLVSAVIEDEARKLARSLDLAGQ